MTKDIEKQLHTLGSELRLSASERTEMREALRDYIGVEPAPELAPARAYRTRLQWFGVLALARRGAVALAGVLLIFGGIGTTFAAEGALPGDTLYPVKQLTEHVRTAVTRSPERKALWYTKLAVRRAHELATLTSTSHPDKQTLAQARARLARQRALAERTVNSLARTRPHVAQKLLSQLARTNPVPAVASSIAPNQDKPADARQQPAHTAAERPRIKPAQPHKPGAEIARPSYHARPSSGTATARPTAAPTAQENTTTTKHSASTNAKPARALSATAPAGSPTHSTTSSSTRKHKQLSKPAQPHKRHNTIKQRIRALLPTRQASSTPVDNAEANVR